VGLLQSLALQRALAAANFMAIPQAGTTMRRGRPTRISLNLFSTEPRFESIDEGGPMR
jgi:hypothetical protein